MNKGKKPSDVNELTFEQALAEIEAITRALESGNLTLEESLKMYERGIGLLRRCYELLQDAETRVEMLMGVDEKGNPITTLFPTGKEPDGGGGMSLQNE